MTHKCIREFFILDRITVTEYNTSVCSDWNPLNDDGRKIINSFLRQHECNDFCRKLQLEGASPESVAPPPTILPNTSVPEFPQPPRLFAPTGPLKSQSAEDNTINTMVSTAPINNAELSSVATGSKAVETLLTVVRRQDGPLRIGIYIYISLLLFLYVLTLIQTGFSPTK